MRMQFVPLFAPILLAGIAVCVRASNDAAERPQDRIAVVGHLPLAGGEVDRLSAMSRYSRNYFYAEDTKLGTVTVIDVTDVKAPSIVQIAHAVNAQSSDLLAVAGTAALIGSPALPSAEPAPRPVRSVSFAQTRVIRRSLANLPASPPSAATAGRCLVFLANPEGIWILSKQPAGGPGRSTGYQDRVTYDH